MATNCSLLKVCLTFCILLTWCNDFVTTSDELKTMDSEQSDNESALTPLQMEILQKWHIDVNIENLIHITNRYIESPRIMARKLFILTLGKELLYNMTVRRKINSCSKHNPLPENVKNFVFEYVNQNSKSGIDNSTFFQTVKALCSYMRNKNRDQLLRTEDDGTLTRLQDQLLHKWGINPNDEILMNITMKYINRPSYMIIELLKMILGDDILENMVNKNIGMPDINNKIIPKDVQDFILEYVNLHTKSNIDPETLLKVIRKKVFSLRMKIKKMSLEGEKLPDFSIDELQMHGIDFQDADSDLLDEFIPDSVQSEGEDTLKLIKKWHIDANVENLTLITEKYIDKPKKMTKELMLMILGKNMLLSMAPKISNVHSSKYVSIPENVQNFVLEYVNSHAESRIDNSTFLKTVSILCKNLRCTNKRSSLMNDFPIATTEGTLSPLQKLNNMQFLDISVAQAELLQKYDINVDEQVLNTITKKYNKKYMRMSIELLKIILGEKTLLNRCIKKQSKHKPKPIPEKVLNFVYEYVNLFTEEKIKKNQFLSSLSRYCSGSRYKYLKRNNSLNNNNS